MAAVHKRPTAADRAPHMVTKMVSRMPPVGIDASSPEQCDGDVPMGCPGERSVECSQDGAEALVAGVWRKMLGQQSPAGAEIIETCKCVEMSPDAVGMHDGLRLQMDRAQQARTRDDKLKAASSVAHQNMLTSVRRQEDACVTDDAGQMERPRIGS